MTINVDLFNTKSIDEAIKRLDDYNKKFVKACDKIEEELARLGAMIVDNNYQMIADSGTYVVDWVQTKDGWMAIAQGDTVVFLEFGTGILTQDYPHPKSEGLPRIAPGEWSQTEGSGQYIVGVHEYWHYRGKKYTGSVATHGFYFAKKELKERGVQIALGIFKEWLT